MPDSAILQALLYRREAKKKSSLSRNRQRNKAIKKSVPNDAVAKASLTKEYGLLQFAMMDAFYIHPEQHKHGRVLKLSFVPSRT